MYFQDYIWFLVALLFCSIFSLIASIRVNSTFSKYDKVPNQSGTTGYDTAVKLMDANNISGISIGRTSGKLTDYFHPKRKVVNLSDSTYSANSVAAVAVAAHEMGHVMQQKTGFLLYKIRAAIVPIVNFGSYMSFPLVIVGVIIDVIMANSNPDLGFNIALVGVILYGGSLLFALITLPVEIDASRRAKKMLLSEGILTQEEIPGASKVLSAAALTYLASLLTSLVYFLRFFVYVLTIFGKRDK